jgi:hypothetical protein
MWLGMSGTLFSQGLMSSRRMPIKIFSMMMRPFFLKIEKLLLHIDGDAVNSSARRPAKKTVLY